jgi:hypothetical protein
MRRLAVVPLIQGMNLPTVFQAANYSAQIVQRTEQPVQYDQWQTPGFGRSGLAGVEFNSHQKFPCGAFAR